MTFAPAGPCSSLTVSSSDVAKGVTYSLYTGGSCTGTPINGVYSGGTYSGGKLLGSFAL